jgi:hypothetical protein
MMTGKLSSTETILYQYWNVIDGSKIRVVADTEVDESYGAQYEVRTERRDEDGEWKTTASGFAANLEVMP